MFIVLDKFFNRISFWTVPFMYYLSLMLIALYYQYSLGFDPCQNCVQIRAIICALIFISLFVCVLRPQGMAKSMAVLLKLALLAGALKLTYQGLLIESGRAMASCAVDGGFPDFMPLDSWFPKVFAVEGICGKSPEMLFGLSMFTWLALLLSIPTMINIIHLVKTFAKWKRKLK